MIGQIPEIFWNKTQYSYTQSYQDTPCFEWTGGKTNRKYGATKIKGKSYYVHRIVYESFVGTIPPKMFVCHHCDNRICINTDHLFIGTHIDNMNDMKMKDRAAKGDKSGRRLHPEKYPIGDKHYLRLHPEKTRLLYNDGARFRGEKNWTSKLTEQQVREIRKNNNKESLSVLARRYGVRKQTISSILKRRTWKHLED